MNTSSWSAMSAGVPTARHTHPLGINLRSSVNGHRRSAFGVNNRFEKPLDPRYFDILDNFVRIILRKIRTEMTRDPGHRPF